MIARVSMLKSRASPDMFPFSLCNKRRLAIRHMNRPIFPTTLSILSLRHREGGRAKDLSATPHKWNKRNLCADTYSISWKPLTFCLLGKRRGKICQKRQGERVKIIQYHYVISKIPPANMHTNLNRTKEAKVEWPCLQLQTLFKSTYTEKFLIQKLQ